MFDLNKITRDNIKKLIPYSSARDEYKGKEGIFLDANENSFGSPVTFEAVDNLSRYPDPLQIQLKEKISTIKGLPIENIFLGNGSDEAIDVLFRIFCDPGKDNVIVCPPTYGMYEVSANINNIEVLKVPLKENFQLNTEKIISEINKNTKLIFICSPNNPTGNVVDINDIKKLIEKFTGIVVVDEAYINFANSKSLITELINYPNLVVLQTLSKAWGLAGLRIGMAFASQQIIDLFNKVKPPYNISSTSQQIAVDALNNIEKINFWIKEIVEEREKLKIELSKFSFVIKVYPSQANFLLVKTTNPDELYSFLAAKQIIVRKRNNVILCEGCIRITIGTKNENEFLIQTLKQF